MRRLPRFAPRALTGLLIGLAAAIAVPAADAGGYRIQAGDVLTISVWKETDLQLEVLVRPDGGLTFPLAGEQAAAGHTVDELRQAIEERLRKYIPGPVVTIAVKQINGNRIYVLGQVNRPGDFPLLRSLDVMQALSLAGGTTAYASVNDIRILRRVDGSQTSMPFRYEEVAHGRNLQQNLQLVSGDTVVVP